MRLLKPGWVHHDEKPIFSVDVHQDCLKFATGGQGNDSGRVVIWNLLPILSDGVECESNVPKILCQMDQHLACVNCVRWSQNGQLLASGSDDKLIMIWRQSQGSSGVFGSGGMQKNPETWRCYYTLRGHAGDVLDLAWSPGDRYLASCSIDNTIIVWNAHSFPMMLTTLKGHTGLVKGVSWDPVGKYLASQSDDRSIKIWKTSDWSCSTSITEPFVECGGTTHILRLSWSPDGQYLVSAHAMNGGGPTAQIIEREGWKCDKDFVGHRKAVTCVRFHNSILRHQTAGEGSPTKAVQYCCLAVGSRDRSLSVWMTALQRPLIVIHDLFKDSILDLSWGPRQCLLMACSGDGTVACLQFDQNELGIQLSEEDKNSIFQRIYGKTLNNGINNANVNTIIEHPDLLHCSKERIAPPTLGLEHQQHQLPIAMAMDRFPSNGSNGFIEINQSVNTPAKAISKQSETRTKDGRRRITPMFIPLHEQTEASTATSTTATATTMMMMTPMSNAETDIQQITSTSTSQLTSSLEPQLSKHDQGRLDSRLNLISANQQLRQPIQFNPDKLENFPRQLNNNNNNTNSSSNQQRQQQQQQQQPMMRKLPTDHQGSTMGPKLNITATSKCEFIKAFGEYRIHVQNGHLQTCHGLLARVVATMAGEELWTLYVGSPVINLNLCSKYVMLCSLDGSMRLILMETGCMVFPVITLTTATIHCAFSPNNELVGVVTECGLLRIWDIADRSVLLATGFNELQVKHGTAVQFSVTDQAMPLLGFAGGYSYSYSKRLQSWLVLSTKDAIMSNGIRATFPRDLITQKINRKLPLFSMQATTQNYIRLTNAIEMNTEMWQPSAKTTFIENQIKLCEALESVDELKYWHKMFAFHLASSGTEKRLRIYLDDLLSNQQQQQQQQSHLKNIGNGELIQCALDTIKPHIRWQRLYTEYLELYKYCRHDISDENIFARPGTPPSAAASGAIGGQLQHPLTMSKCQKLEVQLT